MTVIAAATARTHAAIAVGEAEELILWGVDRISR